MGMAAGQARLLSITSRMSDNELRAQIINNNKMRLATQSSQASEAYVTALNEAQMMFTNYDENNNVSYQKLTYNALTAYNPYNNQYIVTNASGNVLLSEADAIKYKNANGDVEKFLKSYGLEKTTTYWDSLLIYSADEDGDKKPDGNKIQYKTDAVAAGVDWIDMPSGYKKKDGSAATISDYLRDLYEGTVTGDNGNPKIHPGYMDAVSSNEYYAYTSALEKYNEKLDELLPTIKSGMDNKLNNLAGTPTGSTTPVKFSAIEPSSWPNNDVAKAKHDMEALSLIIDSAKAYAIDNTAKGELDALKKIVDANRGDTMPVGDTMKPGFKPEYNYTLASVSNKLTLSDPEGNEIFSIQKTGVSPLATYSGTYTITKEEEDGTTTTQSVTINRDGSGTPLKFYCDVPNTNGTSGNTRITIEGIDDSYFNSSLEEKTVNNFEINATQPNLFDNMKSVTEEVISQLKSIIFAVWDPMYKTGSTYAFLDTNSDEYKEFEDAILGKTNPSTGNREGGLLAAVGLTAVPSGLTYFDLGKIDNIYNNLSGTAKNNFQKVYDAYQLDCIMNTFGEPNYTWIDTSNPTNDKDSSYNQNGQAKAQWYENLFERIQKGGFKVLLDGLASSNEWIQFAFESGIITMEQVDSNKNWQPLIYSNCSDITEQTNDAAIAKAEAEYKAAMNKIENKDKRYDLELKNIDTEHNSLQVEYDSIKTAIDKNIERTFKLYS